MAGDRDTTAGVLILVVVVVPSRRSLRKYQECIFGVLVAVGGSLAALVRLMSFTER
jgi:hypothetical protein